MSKPPIDDRSLRAHYDDRYFERYEAPTLLGPIAGERPYFYGYWMRWLEHRLPAGARVLEVGSGGGYLQRRLQQRYRSMAIDVSLAGVARVRARVPAAAVACADAQRMPFATGTFAAIIAFDVIEHLPDPERFLAESCRVLAAGGHLVFSTPNPRSLGARLKRDPQVPDADWNESMRVWHGRRDETHVNIRSRLAWRQAVAEAGLTLDRDGTDGWWDTPYFRRVPRLVEKALGNGFNHCINAAVGFLPWEQGENLYVIARKPSVA